MSEPNSGAPLATPTAETPPALNAVVSELLAPFTHRIDILEKKLRSLEGDMQRMKNRPTTSG